MGGDKECHDMIIGRLDSVDFTNNEYQKLQSYVSHLLNLYDEYEGEPLPDHLFTRKALLDFCKDKTLFPESNYQSQSQEPDYEEMKNDDYFDDEDYYDPKSDQKELSQFVKTHPFPTRQEIVAFNIKFNKPERT